MIHIKVPGKLYLAGEYAVLSAGNPALVFTVDRFMNLSLSFKETEGLIVDNDFPPILWTRQDPVYYNNDDHFAMLFASIRITDRYLQALNIDLKYYEIHIQTELKEDNIKLGLGSSAAISVGVIKGILALYELPITPLLIYKLAVCAHLDLNLVGSFGDIAACAYTGLIKYSSVDRQWLQIKQRNLEFLDLLEESWPSLKIKSLPALDFVTYFVGWTKASVSTQKMVQKLQSSSLSENFHRYFLKESQYLVEQIEQSIETKDIVLFQNYIQRHRHLLSQLQQETDLLIETEVLSEFIKIAEQFGGVAKTSGAGGGDCGLAFFDDSKPTEPIMEAWRQASVQIIPLKFYQEVSYDEKR